MSLSGSIDLSADLGEGFAWDAELIERISSASVGCGAHAGDRPSIGATLDRAAEIGVVVGAHPGFADREGFGRRELALPAGAVRRLVVDQVATLAGWTGARGVAIRFLKPHGALYNQAQRDPKVAAEVVVAARELGLPVLGLPGGRVEGEARIAGVRFVAEGFVDRGYRGDGTLIARDEPGAILDDRGAVAEQAIRLVRAGRVETLCLHGDDPRAVERADWVREALEAAGVGVRAFA